MEIPRQCRFGYAQDQGVQNGAAGSFFGQLDLSYLSPICRGPERHPFRTYPAFTTPAVILIRPLDTNHSSPARDFSFRMRDKRFPELFPNVVFLIDSAVKPATLT